MKITDVRIRQLEATFEYPGTFWEERVRTPNDIYPEFKARGAGQTRYGYQMTDGRYKVIRNYVQIETDEGVSGIAGAIFANAPAYYIDTQLKPFLVGQDPIATERLWDQMYRNAVNGRKGDNMVAISYVDIALWDIKCKWLGQPLYRLLGGPVQDRVPAYASAGGYSLEPEKVRQRVRQFREEGYIGTKWFMREGPTDGPEGERKIIELVRTIREAAGPDMEIMIDAWNSWDLPYTLRMVEQLKGFRLYWIEEALLPDLARSYARLREKSPIAIAAGEHVYTRWGTKSLIDMGALDIYQIDPAWGGGISETMKICALASAYDLPLVLHGSLVPVNAHISVSQNATLIPMMEYLVHFNEMSQIFFKNPTKPVGGFFTPPQAPGVGLDLDESKIETERDISWSK